MVLPNINDLVNVASVPVPTDGAAAQIGKVALFVFGTDEKEADAFTTADLVEAAQFARAHNIDSIVPKRADGTIKWYGTPEQLAAERQAVLKEGCGYLPFAYCYGPKFGTNQIHGECAVLAEMMAANGHMVCADLETEWDGNPGAASLFGTLMRPVPGYLYLTTFADPQIQNFPITSMNACVDAWVPQDYDNFLASCERQQIAIGMSIRFPAVDLSQEFGANNPEAIAKQARAYSDASLWLWDYRYALRNPGLVDAIVAAYRG